MKNIIYLFFSSLSLEVIQLPHGIMGRKQPIFIRKAYKDLLQIIDKHFLKSGRVTITGNPGTGKTYFGFFLLHKLALRGATVVYQTTLGMRVLCFSGNHLFDIPAHTRRN